MPGVSSAPSGLRRGNDCNAWIEACAPIFGGEDFDRRRRDHGNKSTAKLRPDDALIAIFARASTRSPGRPIFSETLLARNDCSAGAEGNGDMRKLGSLLPSRLRRRLAQIVAIAAASLPAAGA
jgi:hypothetical protein